MSVYEEGAIPEDEKRHKKAGRVVKQEDWICGVLKNGTVYVYIYLEVLNGQDSFFGHIKRRIVPLG